MKFILKPVKPGRNFCEGHNLIAWHSLGDGTPQSGVFFWFEPGCCCGPRAKLLDNSLIMNHKQIFPPSTLRWIYKHLVVLEVRPVSVRQSCPAATQLPSLPAQVFLGCDPAALLILWDELSSSCGYLSLQAMLSQCVKHLSPMSWNPLQFLVFSLKNAELLIRAANRGNGNPLHPQTCSG